MSQSFLKTPSDAPVDATYLLQVADARGILTAPQVLGSLATGYRKNTTGSGVQSVQAVPIPRADGGTNTTSYANTNGVVFSTSTALSTTVAGTNNTVLHGNTGSAPTYSVVSLTADQTGVLPVVNGGTNNSSAYTAAFIMFFDGTKINQTQGPNGDALAWDDTNNTLLLGGITVAAADITLDNDGTVGINNNATSLNGLRIESDLYANMLVTDMANNEVHFHNSSTTGNHIVEFTSAETNFNDNAQNMDWRVEGQTKPNLVFSDASADQVGINTNTPHSTCDVVGGISLSFVTKTATYAPTANDFAISFTTLSVGTTNLNLPLANVAGKQYFVKRAAATDATKVLIVNPQAGDTIDGVPVTGVALAAQWSGVWLMSDGGTNWNIIKQI